MLSEGSIKFLRLMRKMMNLLTWSPLLQKPATKHKWLKPSEPEKNEKPAFPRNQSSFSLAPICRFGSWQLLSTFLDFHINMSTSYPEGNNLQTLCKS